jgi:hypothetical protein
MINSEIEFCVFEVDVFLGLCLFCVDDNDEGEFVLIA